MPGGLVDSHCLLLCGCSADLMHNLSAAPVYQSQTLYLHPPQLPPLQQWTEARMRASAILKKQCRFSMNCVEQNNEDAAQGSYRPVEMDLVHCWRMYARREQLIQMKDKEGERERGTERHREWESTRSPLWAGHHRIMLFNLVYSQMNNKINKTWIIHRGVELLYVQLSWLSTM